MSWNWWQAKPGRLGQATVLCASGQIGGANYLGGASPLTVNNTTTFRLPTPPYKSQFLRLCASVVTVPADADGTILARAMKYDAAADAQVTLSADIDLEALVTRELTRVGILSTATPPQLVFNGTSDALEINVVNNSAAIDTQPAGLVFTVAFALLS